MEEKLLIVIAKYKEDISWTQELKYPFIIYNKNHLENDKYEHNLPNTGNEAHTFFYHIVKNYDNLNSYTAFLQGKPFDHCPNIIKIINEFKFDTEFLPMGQKMGNYLARGVEQQMIDYAKLIQFSLTLPGYMVPGAQYIISKKQIHTRNLEFYQRLVKDLEEPVRHRQASYDAEKTLFQIYNIQMPDRWEM